MQNSGLGSVLVTRHFNLSTVTLCAISSVMHCILSRILTVTIDAWPGAVRPRDRRCFCLIQFGVNHGTGSSKTWYGPYYKSYYEIDSRLLRKMVLMWLHGSQELRTERIGTRD
ncbi:MAG: hypothetical protein M2R45_04724 [Verrucomicrobia subdivision 3 bacterium]|nr:hypothetical protein [Limisphaerales bacterium]MCS1415744.1 hypothetical protein [Limisphaerales bacterium]